MGGCCGAMKTGQKSLPDKKKSADAGQEKSNGKEAVQATVSANDTGKASVDGGEIHAQEKQRDIEGQTLQQIAAPVKVSVSHVEPVQDTALEPPVQVAENIMDLETAVAPFDSLPSSGDQSQQEAQGSITSAEPEVLLPFQIPVQHTFTTTTTTTTTVRHEETSEDFKLRVEEPQLDAAFPGDVQLTIRENVESVPVEEAPVPDDVEILAKSFAAAEVEALPEPVPAEKVESGVEEAVIRAESATFEAPLPLEEDLPPPPPVEAPQPEELEAGGRFEVDGSLPVPAPLEEPSESEPAPKAIIAICPPFLGDIPYVRIDTVEESNASEEVTPADVPEPSPQEQVSVDLDAQNAPEEPTAVVESVQREPVHVQESAPAPEQETPSYEEAAVPVQVPSQEVAPAEELHSREQVPVELGFGTEPLIPAVDDLPPPAAEEPAKVDSVLESYEVIDSPAEPLPQPPVEEAVGIAEPLLPSSTEKELLSEQPLPNEVEQTVVTVQEPSHLEPVTVGETETEVPKQVVAEEAAPPATEAPEEASQVQQLEDLPPPVSQELTEEVPTQAAQEVSPAEELPSVEQQQPVNFDGITEEQSAVVEPSVPAVHQEPVDATPQEKVESVSSEQLEQEGKASETQQLAEGNVAAESAEIVVAGTPSELDQGLVEEPAPYVEQQSQEPAPQQEQQHEEPAPYQEQQIEVPAPYHEQQSQEPTSQQEQQLQEPEPYHEQQPEESASQQTSGPVEETGDAVQSSLQEEQKPQETSEQLPVLEAVSEQVQESRDTWWNESGKEQDGQQETTTDDVPVLELVSEQVREAHQIWWDQSGASTEATQPEESKTAQSPREQGSSTEEPSSIPSSDPPPTETAPIQPEEVVAPIADGLLPEVTSESISSSSDAVVSQQEAEVVPETKELPVIDSPLSADGSSATLPTENGEVSTQSSDETSVSNLSPEGIDDAAAAAAVASGKEPISTQA